MAIEKEGLSLVQWKAAELFAIGNKIGIKEVAKKCSVQPSTVKEWRKDPKFKLAILKRFEENMSELRSQRVAKISNFLPPLYKILRKKLKNLDEDTYSVRELVNLITKLHSEVRVDSVNFMKNKNLLLMLAEYTGYDPDALSDEEAGRIDSVEGRKIRRRIQEQKEVEKRVAKNQNKRKRAKKKKL